MTTVGTLLGGKENDTMEQMRDVLEFEIKLAKVCSCAYNFELLFPRR